MIPGGGYGVAPWVMRSLQGNLCPAKELCTATMEVHLLPSCAVCLSHCQGVCYDLIAVMPINFCKNKQTHVHTYIYIKTHTHTYIHAHAFTCTQVHGLSYPSPPPVTHGCCISWNGLEPGQQQDVPHGQWPEEAVDLQL